MNPSRTEPPPSSRLDEYVYTINYGLTMIFSIVALFFAFLMISIVLFDRSTRTLTNILICNSSIIVICFHFLTIFSMIYALRTDWISNQPACHFRAYAYAMLSAALCYSYTIQALSQLFVTIFYRFKFLLTKQNHFLMIFISWLISAGLATMPLFVDHGYVFEEETRLCIPTSKIFFTSIYVVVIGFVIPLNFITIIYAMIFYYVRQSTRRVFAFRSNTIQNIGNLSIFAVRRDMKLMRNMLILLGILITGGTPFLMLIIWQAISKEPPATHFYILSINFIPNCISINMVLLFFMSKEVKRRLLMPIRKVKAIFSLNDQNSLN